MPPIHPLRPGAVFRVSDDIVRELQNSVAHSSLVRAPAPLHSVDVWVRASHQSAASASTRPLSLVPWLIAAAMVVAGLLYVSQYGLHVKANVVQEGNAAIGSLVAAKDNLEQMDFSAAQEKFSQAFAHFNQAHDDLGFIGSGVGSVLAKLPGGGAIRTAHNLIEAGRLISEAGSSLSEAVSAFSTSSSLLDPASDNRISLGKVLLPMQEALSRAHTNMNAAATLLASVDPSALPQQSQAQFTEFMKRLPEAQALIEQANAGVAFLSRLSGTDRPRRYLMLFQNSSELRPTGGFPGSYGLVTFENGRIRDMSTDDIYNPDGQIRQLIIPPLQLQHITPSWGMRDANWFIDFPASARKVMEFYQKGGGTAVDGVIAIRPDILVDILRITGPISMPQYNVVLTADNFLPTVQAQVESQTTKEPKKIIMDLAPLVLQKLASMPSPQWAKVLGVFKQGLAQRDILMYLDDSELQQYVTNQGWDGRVKDTPGDYLTVNISNIKGAKADAVTDTAVKLESWLDTGTMVHRLTLTRAHNGGTSEYAFYNKTNYSYVRVLVPKGSTLRGITGNDRPVNRPMVDYVTEHGVRDPDLARLEATYQYDPVQGVTTSEESGKTGFGFWMKVDPGQTQSVQLEYAVPARAVASTYRLYVQRQPGLDLSDFEFTLQKKGLSQPVSANVPLTEWPDSWRLDNQLRKDLDLAINLY